jgi:hypothetical protein
MLINFYGFNKTKSYCVPSSMAFVRHRRHLKLSLFINPTFVLYLLFFGPGTLFKNGDKLRKSTAYSKMAKIFKKSQIPLSLNSLYFFVRRLDTSRISTQPLYWHFQYNNEQSNGSTLLHWKRCLGIGRNAGGTEQVLCNVLHCIFLLRKVEKIRFAQCLFLMPKLADQTNYSRLLIIKKKGAL